MNAVSLTLLGFLILCGCLACGVPGGMSVGVSRAHAANDDVIGRIKTVTGAAFLVDGASRRPAEVGAPVRRADVIETGADGAVGLTLTDNTVLSAGPGSQLVIREYTFDSAAFKGGMRARLNRGSLAVTSGDIARGSPEAMQVETPTAVLGVRGTTFLVRAGQD